MFAISFLCTDPESLCTRRYQDKIASKCWSVGKTGLGYLNPFFDERQYIHHFFLNIEGLFFLSRSFPGAAHTYATQLKLVSLSPGDERPEMNKQLDNQERGGRGEETLRHIWRSSFHCNRDVTIRNSPATFRERHNSPGPTRKQRRRRRPTRWQRPWPGRTYPYQEGHTIKYLHSSSQHRPQQNSTRQIGGLRSGSG